jgi:hypothetical protein
MNREKNGASIDLDRALTAVREEKIEDRVIEHAACRVRAGLFQAREPEDSQVPEHTIRGCDDFRTLMPAYLSQHLSPARKLLLEDHFRECVCCRQALRVARGDEVPSQELSFRIPWYRRKWVLAGTVGIVLTLVAAAILSGLLPGLLPFNRGNIATVEAARGFIFTVSGPQTIPLTANARLRAGEEVRTAAGSSAAMRLADGSEIEMGERADVWVSRAWNGATIHLRQGSVIVQAAKQRGKHRLQVATPDCLVSVKGTVFAVTQGLGAARIAVIQGVVIVHHMRRAHVLEAGDEYSTGTSLAKVPIREDIAWSQHAGRYLALLGEFAHIQKQLESIPGPPLRYRSRLARYLPRETVIYAAIPNLAPTLRDAQTLFEQHLRSSEVLRQWWDQQTASGTAEVIGVALGEVRAVSDYLGSEIILGWAQEVEGRQSSPVILAEVRKPGFRAFLQSQLNTLSGIGGPRLRIVTNPSAILKPPADGSGVYLLLKDHILAITTSAAMLRTEARLIERERPGGFTSTPFYSAIQEQYQNGAGWVFCADLEQIAGHSVSIKGHSPNPELGQTGFEGVKYLVIERKSSEGRTESRAVLTFAGQRTGVAGWLAAPSPMGTLSFVSPDAAAAISLVLGEPQSILADVFRIAGSKDQSFRRNLDRFETETHLNIEQDLAGSLGGEITFAQDGPLLPTPSWVAVLDAYQPQRLQVAIEHLINCVNQNFKGSLPPLSLTKTQGGRRTDYTLQLGPQTGPRADSSKAHQVVYTFDDGYMILAPDQAALARAIQNHESGYTLTRSAEFRAAMPRDQNPYCSALVYGNLKAKLAGITNLLESSQAVTPEERASLQKLDQENHPTVVCAFGEPDRIAVAATGSFFGLGLDALAGIGNSEPHFMTRQNHDPRHERRN